MCGYINRYVWYNHLFKVGGLIMSYKYKSDCGCNRVWMSTYFRDDGAIANVYQIITDKSNNIHGEKPPHSIFSITYKDKNDVLITHEDFPDNSLSYVEDAADNWALGIKKLGS